MIIDAHAHAYLQPRISYTRDGLTYMSAQQQIEIMNRMQIDMAVLLPLSSPEASPETQSIGEVLAICAEYPGRFIPFCNIDPRLTNFLFSVDQAYFEFLVAQYMELGCRGMGEVTAHVWWDDPKLWQLFAAVEKVGWPVTFHTCTAGTEDYGLVDEVGFPRLERTLQRFPELVFLAHSNAWWAEITGDVTPKDKIGYPGGPVRPGGAVQRLLRKYPQLYGDISANSGLNALTRDPQHACEFIDEFQDKLVLGLDYCSIKNERKHVPWLTTMRDEGKVSEQAFKKIMWKNINRLLDLGLE